MASSPKPHMDAALEDIFGSDLGSDDEAMRADLQRQRSAAKKTPLSDDENHAPELAFSDRDEEPASTRTSRKRQYHDSDDDSPPVNQEPHNSSEDQLPSQRQRARGRERQRKQKRNTRDDRRTSRHSDLDRDSEDHLPQDDDWKHTTPHHEPEEPPKPEKPKTAFEKALEENKALRRPRRKELDPAKVDNECVSFLERMMKARDDDVIANKKGKPALAKLMMLRDVELMCMKLSHRESLLDNMLLAIIKSWLDPAPDGSLPNVQIRQSLLDILISFPVDNDWVERLESSQSLGRLVRFMSVREPHEPIKRVAEKLMRKWARPVYQSNSNYHDLLEEFDKPDEGRRAPKDGIASERRAARENINKMKTTQEKLREFSSSGKKREQVLATVPRPGTFLYSTLAESEVPVDSKAIRDARTSKARAKKVNRTMSRLRQLNKNSSARAAKPSINGRDC